LWVVGRGHTFQGGHTWFWPGRKGRCVLPLPADGRMYEGVELTRATDPVLILIFRGIHQVLSAEKRLKGGGVPLRLIPVPRRLTSDCGLAIRIPLDRRDRAREILSGARLLPVSAHLPREGGEYDPVPL